MNKINVKFNLLNKQNKKSLILISVTWEGNRIQMSSGLSIDTSHFDLKKGKLKNSSANAFENNQYLDNLAQELKNYYTSMKANHVSISKEQLKNKLINIINPGLRNKKILDLSILKYFSEFIEERKNSPIYGHRTIQRYITAKNHLEKYFSFTNSNITFQSLNFDFPEKFIIFLTQDAGMVNNSAEGIIKTLKVFFNDSNEKGILINIKFKKFFNDAIRSFKLKTDTQAVALTDDEIKFLEKIKLPSKRLSQIRDLFLIQIFTCTRYSDLQNLKPENIFINEGKIRIYQMKTADPTIIPLSKRLMKILNKYDGLILPKYSNQKFNNYIKEVCKLAGINTKIEITKYYGKRRVDEIYEKWQLISSHTARRTNITVSLKKNVLPEMVMQISGHKSRASFQKYVKIAQSEALEAMRKVWD